MREILFRGKIKNIDELIGKGFLTDGAVNSISKWVYGVPIPRYPDLFLAWSEGNGEYEEITIIPKSVTQYTGLSDKNGVKIFEADILKNILDNSISVVEWSEVHTGFTLKTRGTIYGFPKIGHEVYKIIGNVYDDVNLLEKGI